MKGISGAAYPSSGRKLQLWMHIFLSKLRGRIHPTVIVLFAVQGLWFYYDATVTSQQHHRPKRKILPVTESSPLSPYYPPSLGQEYNGYSRIFVPKPFPCETLMNRAELSSRTGANEGFLFVNEMESGSTILAGVTARIAQRMAAKKLAGQSTDNHANVTKQVCMARLMPMRSRKFQNRDLAKSFLWSVLQEPVVRIMHKAFQFARIRNRPVDNVPLNMFQDYVLNFEQQDYGYYLRTLPVKEKLNPYDTRYHEEFVRQVLDSYDFLGVKERFHESLATLQLLLGLDTADMLYLQSPYVAASRPDDPVSSQTDFYEQWNKGSCREVPSPKVTLEMKGWFHSEEFEAFVQADVLMYKAVNTSLDRTIDSLGRDRVERAVKQLDWAISNVKKPCTNTRFPCSVSGEILLSTDCYFSDVGCGHECLDRESKSLTTNRAFQKISERR
ncbi:galactose-3-O-sulfotransferase [Nitzschia inconspicua]|uniref:Galactose-3-O-sulfotransferase n=1 Tax=Nitzschia inconspicua TaxID=303405 RepID=A0A9K3M3H2_9STRA|nr:galactose-3-O-sulfotransferase [Nitzschia inconspicua]